MFFSKMNNKELINAKKGMIVGFYTYLLVSAVNYLYYLFKESNLFSPIFIFLSGLLTFFLFELILNIKDKLVKKNIKN